MLSWREKQSSEALLWPSCPRVIAESSIGTARNLPVPSFSKHERLKQQHWNLLKRWCFHLKFTLHSSSEVQQSLSFRLSLVCHQLCLPEPDFSVQKSELARWWCSLSDIFGKIMAGFCLDVTLPLVCQLLWCSISEGSSDASLWFFWLVWMLFTQVLHEVPNTQEGEETKRNMLVVENVVFQNKLNEAWATRKRWLETWFFCFESIF